jgi:glycerol-3-phosphate dehydrogenase subunit B
LSYDCIVVGAGLSGLTAAHLLASHGMRTVVLAKGDGSLYLGGSTVDVLGYAPDAVLSPAERLSDLVSERPDHPYARAGPDALAHSVDWLRSVVSGLQGNVDQNMLLATAVGVPKPTAVAADSVAAGDLRGGGSYVFCGFRALKDFFPDYLSSNLTKASVGAELSARSVWIDAAPWGEADVGGVAIARALENPGYRAEVIAGLRGRVEPSERVGFPAVLGLDAAEQVRGEISEALGATVFEVPALPPSVPGIRLYKEMRRSLANQGCRMTMGATAVGARTSSGRVDALKVDLLNRVREMKTGYVVLATGGIATGGIELDSYWQMRETVLGLPVSFLPAAGEDRFSVEYFADHGIGRAGVAVDGAMRPVGPSGDPVFENVRVAGATIGGAEPWKEKSGNGIGLATGFAAARSILENEGAWN